MLFASAYWFLMSLKKDLHSSGFCYWVVDCNNGSRQSLLLSTGGVCVLRIARKAALSSQEKE